MESHESDTQETYYEGSNNKEMISETQNTSLNESQDFRLVDSETDDFLDKPHNTVEKMRPLETTKDNCQKSVVESDLQENSHILDDKLIIESKNDQEKVEKEYTKMIEKNNDIEKKTELSDNEEDEVIPGTPPYNYSPPKPFDKVLGGTEIVNLKRKAESFDDPPAKILRTSVMDVFTLKEESKKEESRKSCESDDSYEELSVNPGKNVLIEETQDFQTNNFTQDSLNNSAKDTETLDDSTTKQHDFQQQAKDENLNVSIKLTEISTNDSITAINSSHENNIQIESNNVSMETNENTSSSVIAFDEKSKTCIQNTTNGSLQVKDTDKVSNEDNKTEQTNAVDKKVIENITNIDPTNDQEQEICGEPQSSTKNTTSCKRMSVEVIYDRARKRIICENKSKPELVEIDEDGEKIVLDALEEDLEVKTVDDTVINKTNTNNVHKHFYETESNDFNFKSLESTKESSLESKSDNKFDNGSDESKRSNSISVESNIFSNNDTLPALGRDDSNIAVHSTKRFKGISFTSNKDTDNIDLISISDNENDISNMEDSTKIHNSALAKSVQIEKEIGIYVRLKCLLHIDESTKEFVGKELMAVHCEPTMEISSTRQKNVDTSSSLADISDNKETSPGSVNSNPQLFHLHPSRSSILSTISSSSSASSAASLAAKLALKDIIHFSQPRRPAKHAKKLTHDIPSIGEKQARDESYDRLTREWKNNRLLTTTILSCANTELGIVDTYNISNDRLDDHYLQKLHSSTPENPENTTELSTTPKSTKKGKIMKRTRSKPVKNVQNNEDANTPNTPHSTQDDNTPSIKKNNIQIDKPLISNTDVLTKSLQNELLNDLIGKDVFAKWSDNNYYPGTIMDKIKAKYKVNFYDGKSKTLIPEFIIPIPKTLRKGLSIYATTKANDYGSCGIIIDIQTITNDIFYVVETDESEQLRVQIKNIFLSADQAQLLKEEVNSENTTFPTTPKHLGQVTLDNMVDGKRRSKRIGTTPGFSTPKRNTAGTSTSKSTNPEPSVSGVSTKLKKGRITFSENEDITSDSNVSVKDEDILRGVQKEIIGTQTVKGPQNKIKGKPRSKKNVEDKQTIALLGPIPQANPDIFKGMSFILACVSLDTLEKYQTASNSGTETENETENEDWVERPFVRDRLQTQIITGGGKVYEKFEQIPKDEYKNTKLITNVPNTTAKSILCLSVGIRAYNHKWIIRCCLEGKIVNPAENVLPTGWSLKKRAYVDMYETIESKPLKETVVAIPTLKSDTQFATFWRQICENAGAVVLVAEDPETMEMMDFENIVIVSNQTCPSWAVDRASQLQIPLLSTTWVIQCLIEGEFCAYDQHSHYKYNCK